MDFFHATLQMVRGPRHIFVYSHSARVAIGYFQSNLRALNDTSEQLLPFGISEKQQYLFKLE